MKPSATPKPLLDESRLRTFTVGSRLLSYRLKRSSRRSIGFVISSSGLTVTAPLRLSLSVIESAIMEKQRWIFTKLLEWADRPSPQTDAPANWQDGALLPFLGEPQTLRLVRRLASDVPASGRRHEAVVYDSETHTLTVSLAASAEATDSARVAALLKRWYQTEARRCFTERLALYAPIVGVRFNALALSSATTRWGSCSSVGNIRLNWRLMHFPLWVIDYVVIHELAHLREMNHSPRFWAIVEAVMPHYRQARAILKHPQAGSLPLL